MCLKKHTTFARKANTSHRLGVYTDRRVPRAGFTLVEIILVVVIITITAMLAVPMMSSASSMQIRAAANVITADLEYAKSIAITRQKIYTVIFDKVNETYRIEDADGVIDHPVKKGFQYIVDFTSDSRMNKVDLTDVDFDATSQIKFDYLGSPYNGDGDPLNSGTINLQADTSEIIIEIEAVTGFVSIQE